MSSCQVTVLCRCRSGAPQTSLIHGCPPGQISKLSSSTTRRLLHLLLSLPPTPQAFPQAEFSEPKLPPMTMAIPPDSPRSVSSTDSAAALPSFEALAPSRAPTTKPAEETVIEIPDLLEPVRLKVDAGPGCGGIAWPSGEVSAHRRSEVAPGTVRAFPCFTL